MPAEPAAQQWFRARLAGSARAIAAVAQLLVAQPAVATTEPDAPDTCLVAAAAAMRIALLSDFAGKVIKILTRKPETIRYGYIRGRQRPHDACRMV